MGDGNTQVANQRGFSVRPVGTGDLNDVVFVLHAVEQGGAQAAVGLGLLGLGLIKGTQERVQGEVLEVELWQGLRGTGNQGYMSQDW